MKRLAFTLTELLVVVAILAVLAAILFPVFTQVKAEARKAVCLSNFRQVATATFMYTTDYDDMFMPTRYQQPVGANARTDRTWVQLLMPYVQDFELFFCPENPAPRWPSEGTFDEDLVPGDTYARYYTASHRVNTGLNFMYLSPLVEDLRGMWYAIPRSMSQIQTGGQTILFADSAANREAVTLTQAGGSYVILPPCRFEDSVPDITDSFMLGHLEDYRIFDGGLMWEREFIDGAHAGGLFTWHRDKLTVVFTDGRAKMMSIPDVVAGCNVLPNWDGLIYDSSRYLWDLE